MLEFIPRPGDNAGDPCDRFLNVEPVSQIAAVRAFLTVRIYWFVSCGHGRPLHKCEELSDVGVRKRRLLLS
ncbi:MAG: hypothetical protein ACK55Z_30510 [bacterium]